MTPQLKSKADDERSLVDSGYPLSVYSQYVSWWALATAVAARCHGCHWPHARRGRLRGLPHGRRRQPRYDNDRGAGCRQGHGRLVLRRVTRRVRGVHALPRRLELPRLGLVRVVGRHQGRQGPNGSDLQERGFLTDVPGRATRLCRVLRPTGDIAPPGQRPRDAEASRRVPLHARPRGPGFSDPNPITGELSAPAGIDRSSPQVVAALQACRSLGQAAGLGPPST